MRIYFARHGESEANLLREFSNSTNRYGLTDRGRQQMATLAHKLDSASITRIYASPILRARESAEIVGQSLSLPVAVSDALREWDVGVLEGRRDDAAWEQYWQLRRAWLEGSRDSKIQGGESLTELEQRFLPFVRALLADEATGPLLLVSHGGLLAAVLPALLDNVTREFAETNGLGNASYILAETIGDELTCVEWGPATPGP